MDFVYLAPAGTGVNADKGIKVVMAYEDFEIGQRVKAGLTLASGQGPFPRPYELIEWKFELLKHPSLLEQAVLDAASADIVIVAAQGHTPLPNSLDSWASRWTAARESAGGTVVLILDGKFEDLPSARAMVNAFAHAANTARMHFEPSFISIIPTLLCWTAGGARAPRG